MIKASTFAVGIAIAMLFVGIGTAQAGPTDAQKCAAAKLKAGGDYSACRAKAMGTAIKKSVAADFSKCDEKLQEAFDKADSKFGAGCAIGNEPDAIGLELADQATNVGCRISGALSGASGSVLVYEVPDFSALVDAKMYLKNATNTITHARCFSTNTGDRCSHAPHIPCSNDSECAPDGTCVTGCDVADSAFTVTLFRQGQIYWYPLTGTGGVPAFHAPRGQIVCVQVDASGFPFTGNSLRGGIAVGAECPTATAIPVVGDPDLSGSDPPFTLNFGPGISEYESCPASIDASLIESCWSQSEFTFVCD